jgi:8-hydroxy-5-deazaflavin:NADPH oxidoreductase
MLEDNSIHYWLIKRQCKSHHSFRQQPINNPRSEFMSTPSNTTNTPTIGIIGAGAVGASFARALAGKGIHATLSNSRGPDSLKDLVRELGPTIHAGTVKEAAAKDIVLVAVNWTSLPAALAGLPDFGGRIIIDANNPVEIPALTPVDLKGRVSSEVFAELVPGARVVKAFNHLMAELLAGNPATQGGKRALFYAGDDADAKTTVAALIQQLGFSGIDLGTLAAGGRMTQFPGGPLAILNLVQLA